MGSQCEDKENSHKKNEIDPSKEEPQFIGIRISREAAYSVYITCWELLGNSTISSGCKQSCSTLKYSGKVIQEAQIIGKEKMKLRYEFAMPMRTQIYEEYIILDAMTVVGVLGGTFGLFIELSFLGIFTSIINYFRANMS